jgi:hypothetical protein
MGDFFELLLKARFARFLLKIKDSRKNMDGKDLQIAKTSAFSRIK